MNGSCPAVAPVLPGFDDPALVRMDRVGRTYGTGAPTIVAVRDISVAVAPRARVALTGPSGSGKSTLLHLMAGLDTPTSGSVTWPGIDLGAATGLVGIGVVFQGPSLLPALDVTENVCLPLLFRDVAEPEAMVRGGDALARVGIGDLARALPDELSGGQAQRVAVARVLAAAPRLILADEPTGQLDHRAAALVIDVLLQAADDLGAALIVSTHDPAISRRLPTEWAMRDGRLHGIHGADARKASMTRIWLTGLLRRHPARLLAAALGVAIAVALLACLGSFLTRSQATMTERAVRTVAVDWQIQVTPTANTTEVARLVAASPGVQGSSTVGFAHTSGLSSSSGASTQNTGPGMVLGLQPGYRTMFPAEIRTLVGADTGVLIAQQTAANLHAAPGDTVTIGRAGLPPARAVVAGVVDLPQANSLFQTVGAPIGAQPTAPPDNVVLLPAAQWHQFFDPLAAARPDLVSTQIHVQRSHALPPNPAAAYARWPRRRRISRPAAPEAPWSATTSVPAWTPPAATPPTPWCCSCSSGFQARCWLRC